MRSWLLFILLCVAFPAIAAAEPITVNSSPPGAQIYYCVGAGCAPTFLHPVLTNLSGNTAPGLYRMFYRLTGHYDSPIYEQNLAPGGSLLFNHTMIPLGSITINSNPSGAQIWYCVGSGCTPNILHPNLTNMVTEVTPSTGVYRMFFRRAGYHDSPIYEQNFTAGSNITFFANLVANNAPIGAFEGLSSNGTAVGWAVDPDAPNSPLTIHFYVGGPSGSGTFAGSVTANQPRIDVNRTTGHAGDHGFVFTLPAQYRNGATHSVYAYALDTAGGTNPLLSGGPKSFAFETLPRAAWNGQIRIGGVNYSSTLYKINSSFGVRPSGIDQTLALLIRAPNPTGAVLVQVVGGRNGAPSASFIETGAEVAQVTSRRHLDAGTNIVFAEYRGSITPGSPSFISPPLPSYNSLIPGYETNEGVEWAHGDLNDVLAILDFVRNGGAGAVDPNKFYLAGGSHGGYLVLAAAARRNYLTRVVSSHGPTDAPGAWDWVQNTPVSDYLGSPGISPASTFEAAAAWANQLEGNIWPTGRQAFGQRIAYSAGGMPGFLNVMPGCDLYSRTPQSQNILVTANTNDYVVPNTQGRAYVRRWQGTYPGIRFAEHTGADYSVPFTSPNLTHGDSIDITIADDYLATGALPTTWLGEVPASVQAKVVDAVSGAPISGATVHVSERHLSCSAPRQATGLTNASGIVSIASPPSGYIRATVAAPGYATAIVDLELQRGVNDLTTGPALLTRLPDSTAPSQPGGFSAVAVSSTQINLSWGASTDNIGVAGYRIRRGGSVVATTAGTTYQDSGRTPSTAYSYTVTAYDVAQNESAASAASATTPAATDSSAPTTPQGLQASAASASRIDLSWSPSSDNVGVTGYRIHRGGTLVATPAGTSYSDTGLSPSTAYTYRVSARDAAGNISEQSSPATATTGALVDTTAPGSPQNLVASALSSSQINLAWTAATDNVGVTGYRVFRDGSLVAVTAATSFQDTGRAPSTAYSYAVYALDAAGNVSAASNVASATTAAAPDSTPPSRPQNLLATAVSSARIALTWSASSDNIGVSGYLIRRNGAQIATVASPGYEDSGLSPGTAYSYEVAAYDATGNASAYSVPASATTAAAPDTTPPSAPQGVSAAAASASQIALSWSASTDNLAVAGYRVYRAGGAVGTTASTSFIDSGLAAGTAYSYTITAYDASGNESAHSASASGTTAGGADVAAPTVPGGVAATAVSHSQINLSWSASTDNLGVTGYRILRGGALVGTTAGLSYQDLSLAAGTLYSYTVAAYDASGNISAPSPAATATTLAAPDATAPSTPLSVTATAVSSTRIDVTWGASSDNVAVAGYRVYRGAALIAVTAATAHQDEGLSASTAYGYTVVAFDASGNASAASASASATTPAPPDLTAPTVPASLAAVAVSSTQINLSWSASSDGTGVAGYRVYRGGALIATTAATSHSDAALTPSTAYSYEVAAFDAAGNVSARSAPVSTTTAALVDPTPPTTPLNLAFAALSPTDVRLTWTASSDNVAVDGYRVFRDGRLVGASRIASFLNSGLLPAATYGYTVAAYDAAGNASTAAAVVALTLPLPPEGGGSALGVSSISWSWSEVAGEDGYHVRTTTGLPVSGALASGTSVWTETGLAANTPYARRFGAYNASGESVSFDATTRYTRAFPPVGSSVSPSSSAVTITWGVNGNPPHTAYQVRYWLAGGSTFTAIVVASTATLGDIPMGTTLYATVRALNGDGIPAESGELLTMFVPAAVLHPDPARQTQLDLVGLSGPISLRVPAGAFPPGTTITARTPAVASLPAGSASMRPLARHIFVDFELNGPFQPQRDVSITMSYQDADLEGVDPSRLQLARWDPSRGQWIALFTMKDRAARRVMAQTDHFSLFQLMAAAGAASDALDGVTVGPSVLRPNQQPGRAMTFRNLPAGAKIRVRSLHGELVYQTVDEGTGTASWDGRNSSGARVASGVYFVTVESGSAQRRLTVAVER